jgi:hypothetical protein
MITQAGWVRSRPPDLKWGRSGLLYSYERGDLTNEMIPISADEAERIISRIRATFGGA